MDFFYCKLEDTVVVITLGDSIFKLTAVSQRDFLKVMTVRSESIGNEISRDHLTY